MKITSADKFRNTVMSIWRDTVNGDVGASVDEYLYTRINCGDNLRGVYKDVIKPYAEWLADSFEDALDYYLTMKEWADEQNSENEL